MSDPLQPVDCSLPNSFVHGIPQARILDWIAIPFSRGSSQPRDQTQVSCITGRFFTIWTTREALWQYPIQTKNSESAPFKAWSDGFAIRPKFGIFMWQNPTIPRDPAVVSGFLVCALETCLFNCFFNCLFNCFSNFERAHHLVTNKLCLNRDSSHCYCCCSGSLFDPMDWLLSSRILQARILERVAFSFSRGSSRPRDQIHVSYISWISRWVLYH